jgi:hypothetical protein
MRRHSPHRQKQPECLRVLVFVALPRTEDFYLAHYDLENDPRRD